MRYTTFRRGGYGQGIIGTTGGDVTGRLYLSRDPIGDKEASTKSYVDVKLNTLPVENFLTGIVPAARVPEFSGDVIKLDGNAVTSVKTTTVAVGMYPKVTVNNKGQVTSGSVLLENDVPVLPWGKLATGKPTTLGGYGITDSLSTSGGVMTGTLTVGEVTSENQSLINKSYIDSVATGGAGVTVGGVVYRNSSTTPVGFLRCNGAELNKDDYSGLYSIIGNSFKTNLLLGSGRYWEQQYGFNKDQTDDLGTWTEVTGLPAALCYSQAIVTKNRVYLLGGAVNSGSSSLSVVYTAPINEDGTLGLWTTGTSLPAGISRSGVVVIKNRVYLIGGWTSGAISNVYSAMINEDGTLGTWVLTGYLPYVLAHTVCFVSNDYVYIFGGWDSVSSYSVVTSAPINPDGTLGTWKQVGTLPFSRSSGKIAVTKNRVYLIGGGQGDSPLSSVITAPINNDGTLGAWTNGPSLPVADWGGGISVTNTKIYYMASSNNNVYTATINPDGTISSWNQSSTYPAAKSLAVTINVKNKLYIIGGNQSGIGYTNKIYSVDFKGGFNDYTPFYDGSVQLLEKVQPGNGRPWQLQYAFNTTQSGDIVDWQLGPALPQPAAASNVAVTKNRAYVFGGASAVNNGVAAIFTAPINVDGTLGAWVSSGALPVVMIAPGVAVTKKRIYLIGGGNNSYNASSYVCSAPINEDGTLGGWSIMTALPVSRDDVITFISKNKLYVLGGGYGSGYPRTVYSANINADGTLDAWVTEPNLPKQTTSSDPFVVGDKVYVMCGSEGEVYSAKLEDDGSIGPWLLAFTMPEQVTSGNFYVTRNIVYYFGGYKSGTLNRTTYRAPIVNGVIGAWISTPNNLSIGQVSKMIATSSKVYMIGGGTSLAAYSSSIQLADITGGLNNYSSFYDGSYDFLESNNLFRLPDIKPDLNAAYAYIKY